MEDFKLLEDEDTLKSNIKTYTKNEKRNFIREWCKSVVFRILFSPKFEKARREINSYIMNGRKRIFLYYSDHLKDDTGYPKMCTINDFNDFGPLYVNICDGYYKGCRFTFESNFRNDKVCIYFDTEHKNGVCNECLVKKGRKGCKCYKKAFFLF